MTDPHRDRRLACPACNAPLREYHARWVCDACDGMMLALPDLATGIHDLTSLTPTFEFRDEKAGQRACPHCAAAMQTCRLRMVLDGETIETRPTLDRCGEHGLWFDGEELAGVFQKVIGKGGGAAVGRKAPRPAHGTAAPSGSYGWRGKSGVPEWWGGGGGGSW